MVQWSHTCLAYGRPWVRYPGHTVPGQFRAEVLVSAADGRRRRAEGITRPLKPNVCKVRLRPCLKKQQQGLERWPSSEGNLLLLQRTWLGFWHQLAGSWPPVTPVPGNPVPPPVLFRFLHTCGAHKFTQEHTHIYFDFLFLRRDITSVWKNCFPSCLLYHYILLKNKPQGHINLSKYC